VSDVEPVDIPDGAVAKLVNARGHKNAIKGRTGVQLWTNLKIPSTKSIGTSYSDGVLSSAELWEHEDVGSTYYADNGDIFFLVEYIDSSNMKVEASENATTGSITTGDVTPRINAQYFDSLNGVRYFLIGTKVYARIGKDLEWIEYFILGDQPTNTTSQMFKIKDKIILTNSNGVYILNSVYDGKYGWKTNDYLPEYKIDLPSQEVSSTRPSAYNYVYTYARMNGLYGEDRNSVDTYLELETPPILVDNDIVTTSDYKPEVLNTDYATMYSNEPVSAALKQDFSTGSISFENYSSWVELSEDNHNPKLIVNINGESRVVYFDFSASESMDDVRDAFARGLKDSSIGFDVSRRVVDSGTTADKTVFSIYHSDPDVVWSFTPDTDGVCEGTDLLSNKIIITEIDYDAGMGVTVGEFRYPSNRNDITHYPLYRSKDIYPYTRDTTDLTDPRIGNSSNIFSWVADIPVVDTINASIVVDMVEYKLVFDEAPGNYLIGSEYTIDAVSPKTVIKIVSQEVGDPNSFKIDWVRGVRTSYENAVMYSGTDTVFTAEKIGNTITVTGYDLTDDDIGKPVFWADGTISYLTSTTTTLDSDSRSSQRAYIDPTRRNWHDTMSDNIRDGYAYYNTLKTRFYDKLPQSNLATYNKGLLVLALRDYNKLYYSDTSELSTIGYNHPNQVNDSIDKGIRCLITVKDVFTIMTTSSTHTINPKQSTVLETDFGEFYTVMPDAFLINASIGGAGQFRWAQGEKGDIMVITNEPAVRFFDGISFTANMADGRVQNTELKLLNEEMLTSYSSIGGIHIWGFRSDLWK